jgi:hypothetical protein
MNHSPQSAPRCLPKMCRYGELSFSLHIYLRVRAILFLSFSLSLWRSQFVFVCVMCVRHRAASELASLALAPRHVIFFLFYMQICEIRGAFHPLSRQLTFKRITCVQIFCQHLTMSLVTFAIERWVRRGPRPSSAI